MDTPCSDLHIAKISEKIVEWELLAPYFGIFDAEQNVIRNDYSLQYGLQKRKMLWKWKQSLGNKATYSKLKECFLFAGNKLLADEVDELLNNPYSQSPHSALAAFKQYLKDCYTLSTQTPSHIHKWHAREWPPYNNAPFVQPQLVLKSKDTMTQGQEKEVSLSDIFSVCKQDKSSVKILLEGVAGSGKTTISWHACQQWAKRNMFHDIEFLIHLSLANPKIQSASSFEDLIPHPSIEMRRIIAEAIVERHGKKCCFILDGWEDLPTTVQTSSFLKSIIQGGDQKVNLSHCAFLVTSRPVASSSIASLMSSTLSMEEFSTANIDSYTTQYFSTQKESKNFLQSVKSRPSAYSLCSLPINLVTMIFLFLNCHHTLPSTQTELYESLVLVLLLRHLRTKRVPQMLPEYLVSFSDLPDPLKPAFNGLCQLAHFASFKYQSQSKVNFSLIQLQKANIQTPEDTLGLMKVSKQLTCHGNIPQYSFLHSAMQDFLCAVWMSKMDEHEADVRFLLRNDPMSSVLQFFAGITQLEEKHQMTLKLLLEVANKPFDPLGPWVELASNPHKSVDHRRLQLTILHCIFESKQEEIFLQVKPKSLQENIACVTFEYYKLSPFDCTVIGQFLSIVLTHFTGRFPLRLRMKDCKIGDHELDHLLQPLFDKMSLLANTTTVNMRLKEFQFFLTSNNITHTSVGKLKRLLTSQYMHITRLFLGGNFDKLKKNEYRNIALNYLIESLSHKNCSLTALDISFSGFTEEQIYQLVLLLIHSHSLKYLFLCGNSLGTSFALFCSGLKLNKSLTLLSLRLVTLSNNDILLLADALHEHLTLSKLCLVDSNPFHSNVFMQFLQKVFSSSRSSLSEIIVNGKQYDLMKQELERYQASRQQNCLPRIDLNIVNEDERAFPEIKVQTEARERLDKSFLTGE